MELIITIIEIGETNPQKYFRLAFSKREEDIIYCVPVLYASWMLPVHHPECTARLNVWRDDLHYDAGSARHAGNQIVFEGFTNVRGTVDTVSENTTYQRMKSHLLADEFNGGDRIAIVGSGYPINGYASVRTLLIKSVIEYARQEK